MSQCYQGIDECCSPSGERARRKHDRHQEHREDALTYGRRRWRWSRLGSVGMAAFVLNLPAWIALLFGLRRGLYGGMSEVLIFAAAYVAGGAAFAATSHEAQGGASRGSL